MKYLILYLVINLLLTLYKRRGNRLKKIIDKKIDDITEYQSGWNKGQYGFVVVTLSLLFALPLYIATNMHSKK